MIPSPRHCERSEAIHSFFMPGHGLLRCARNDDEILKRDTTVIPRAGGDPVRRGFSVQSLASLEYWIVRLRGGRRQNMTSRSRGMNCPRFGSSLPSSKTEGAGKTGCLLHPRSRVLFAHSKSCTRAYRAAGTLRPSLRNGFTAYFVLSPENGSFASVVGGILPANVMPAPRHQNHTTSPYA